MKKTVLLFWLLPLVISAQSIRIDSLPSQGILLEKGWKWHAGDDPAFAKPDFDDSKWERIDPTKDIMDLSKVQKAGVSWLRLSLEMDTSLTKQGLALLLWQNGATEIYVDNEKLQQLGAFSGSDKTINAARTWGKTVYLPNLSPYKKHTIAVRFGFDQEISYIKWFGWTNHAMRMIICRAEEAENNYFVQEINTSKLLDIFKIGIFIILTILHFSLYFNYKKQKGNLIMGVYALVAGFAFGAAYLSKTIFDLKSVSMFIWATALLNILTIIFILELIYYLFFGKKGVPYFILIGLCFLGLPCLFYFYDTGWLIIVLLMFLVSAEVIRLGIFTKKSTSNSQRIIIYGGGISVIFYTIAIVISSDPDLTFLKHLSYNISYLSLPVSFSLFLSFEFAIANKSLEKQILKVEELSAEKQQILSTQNELLEKQVEVRTAELKASQAQLIQKEKLASLGELTAGIAHEIQNPLNFVNNFSELSVELIEEAPRPPMGANENWLPQEAPIGGWGPFFDDLSQNLEKINWHGKRASAIVKGMLEHSRMGTGERVLTDLNTLCDEYLRLSYHGMRAKDKNFNADYELIADPNLPKINVVPQDIGRVLLNLINNAFYAVQGVENPKVIVSASSNDAITLSDGIVIKVTDNGTGMPEYIKAKIFQPFFTTKPTGEGTGLGLSLSYDIVTKGHGGTLEVESVEGEGTTFIVTLPL
ncbi:MAG: ATP-binding protein [Spirosomataceae bacterium]